MSTDTVVSIGVKLLSRSMLLLILAGLVYAIWFDSLPVSILTAAMILYRAQRPSKFRQRIRDAWYARAAAAIGDESE